MKTLRFLPGGSLALLFLLHLGSAGEGRGATTLWNFDTVQNPLAASSGPAVMTYYDPGTTGWGPAGTMFGKASDLGLPPLPGGDADVMGFPATTSGQGFQVTHNAAPNGVHADQGLVCNYTLVIDLLWPASSDGVYRSLYQTSTANANDGELFALNQPSGGIGIVGNYHGSLAPDTWHRIVVTVRAANGEGQMHKYIDGTFVGAQGTTGSAIDIRWTLDPTFLFFADNDGETAPGYVSSITFIDRQLTMAEAKALGGPHAGGTDTPGAAPAEEPYFIRSAGLIGHRGHSCCAPENTLSAINDAFDRGAVACEVDIRLSADGVAVLMHDASVDRTTDGTGAVSGYTVAQLKALDAGSWFDPAFAGEQVPTLAEALQAAAGRGRLLLDVKITGMGAAINQALIDAGGDATAIWPWPGDSGSYAPDFQANIPGLQSVAGSVPASLEPASFNALKSLGVVGFDLGQGAVTRPFIEAAHANSMFVSAYTILDPIQAENLIDLGIDMFETDVVDYLQGRMPPYDIDYYDPADIPYGTPLGPEQLDATASVAGTFTYDPPEGTVLPPGSHDLVATFTPEEITFPVRSHTVQIRVLPPAPQTFSEWSAEFMISPVPDVDLEGDEVFNIFEYVHVGDPLTPDADLLLPRVDIRPGNGDPFAALHLRFSRTLAGVRVEVERSLTLETWVSIYDFTADTDLASPLLLEVRDLGTHYDLVLRDPNTVAENGNRAFYRVTVEPLGIDDLLNQNLIVNSGAEQDAPGVAAGQDIVVTGWTDTSGRITAQQYNGYAVDNVETGGMPPVQAFGSLYFYGGEGWGSGAGTATLSQSIDVAALAMQIDAGTIRYTASGFFGGWSTQNDTASLTLRFLDGVGGQVAQSTLGAPSAAARGNQSGYVFSRSSANVPTGTRRIEVVVNFIKEAGGTYNDGAAENLILILSL